MLHLLELQKARFFRIPGISSPIPKLGSLFTIPFPLKVSDLHSESDPLAKNPVLRLRSFQVEEEPHFISERLPHIGG